MEAFETNILKCLGVLEGGGVILFPTETAWALGCDATNEDAVRRIYKIKHQRDFERLIVLLADERDVLRYVAAPDLSVFDFLETQERPTTVVFDHAINLAESLLAQDGSVGIRLAQDAFCRSLIKRFRKPIVSSPARISAEQTPSCFTEVTQTFRKGVDFIAQWGQQETSTSHPSQIIRWKNGEAEFILR